MTIQYVIQDTFSLAFLKDGKSRDIAPLMFESQEPLEGCVD